MSSTVIDCKKLSKRYGKSDVYALKDLTLQVNAGEVYGFLGPNGAGKSTAIRTLLNFLQPTSGSATIMGYDIVKDGVKIRESIGYLSGDAALYPKMTGQQFLDYMASLQPKTDLAYRQDLTRRLGAVPDKQLGTLSRGNKQKIGIIQAFMHRPKVIIMDEPTSGLDPLMQEVFYDIVNEAKGREAAIFSSSHILGEVQKLCDRVGIIRDGQLVAEKDIADLTREASQTFDIIFSDKPPIAALKKIAGLHVGESEGSHVVIHMSGELAPLFSLLAKHKVTKLDARSLDLEEVFLDFYGEKRGKS